LAKLCFLLAEVNHLYIIKTACQVVHGPGSETGVKLQDYIFKDGTLKGDNHTPGCTWPDSRTGGKTEKLYKQRLHIKMLSCQAVQGKEHLN
jgi:hypothetical protein